MLSRNDQLLSKLRNSGDWDLIVVDEAHKMSARHYGGEISRTKRYRLGEELEKRTRHLLMMTATPHNGREADFQLFMALIDGDRFAGRFRPAENTGDLTDIMRRLTKEELLRFDGTQLFPERVARTVQYQLSEEERQLYDDVTNYVQHEMERVDRFVNQDNRHKYVVGFALQLLQRRLASSPNAIYQSLKRRHERLKQQLKHYEYSSNRQHEKQKFYDTNQFSTISDDLDDIDDDEDYEDEDAKNDQELISEIATTAETIDELNAEVKILGRLVQQAHDMLISDNDAKWLKLKEILNDEVMLEDDRTQRKLIVFTEARDTLSYLQNKIAKHIRDSAAVAVIHGGVARDERHKIISRFMQDKTLKILVANDAAGEGVNLQRAYLMVNYDLPWNPNKIEQRFGRIHRIGQTKKCYLWNLVAADTREGDVYARLLQKLENVKSSLKGHVFDVLGEIFEGTSLKQLLLDAIQHGGNPDKKHQILLKVDQAAREEHIQELLNKRKLTNDIISGEEVNEVRMEMEIAEARRLQPHHIQSFFIHAFTRLNGTIKLREKGRYEVEFVPKDIRKRAKANAYGHFIPDRYERICFEKQYINHKPDAEFIVPGHPLLETVIGLILEKYFKLLKCGALMVDDQDYGTEIRTVFLMEHSIEDGRTTVSGKQQVISKQLQFIQITKDGNISEAGSSPHLDLRPIRQNELVLIQPELDDLKLATDIVRKVRDFAVKEIVIPQINDIRSRRFEEIDKIEKEVKTRLTGEIDYYHSQIEKFLEQEKAGRDVRLALQNARSRSTLLQERLENRLTVLEQERNISTAAPAVQGAFLVIPKGMLTERKPLDPGAEDDISPEVEISIQKKAIDAVLHAEASQGFEPENVSNQHRGYDILSFDRQNKSYRFIKAKGYSTGSKDVITSLNKPSSYYIALVRIDGEENGEVVYVQNPFVIDPKFNYTIYPFEIQKLLAKVGNSEL